VERRRRLAPRPGEHAAWQVQAGLLPSAAGARIHARLGIDRPEGPATVARRIPPAIRFTFLVFIFWMPLEAAGLNYLPTPGRIAGIPFFLSCLFAPSLCFRKPKPATLYFSTYLLLAGFHGLFSQRGVGAFGAFLTMTQLMVFAWIAGSLFRSTRLARQALRSYGAATVILAVGTLGGLPGFAGKIEGATATEIRTTAFAQNPNDVAGMAALGAIILLGEFMSPGKKRLYRWACALGGLADVALIVRTASRAGFAALMLGLAVFMLPGSGMRRSFVAGLQALVMVAGALYLLLRGPVLEGRMGSFYRTGDVTREHIYRAALEMIMKKPIAGWGPVVAQIQLGARVASKTGTRDAHNLLLTLLLEVGAIGAIPFLIGLYYVGLAAWRGRAGPIGLVPLALLAVILMTNVAHTNLAWKSMWFVLAMAMSPIPPQALPSRMKAVRRAPAPRVPVRA
jgi:O-antigen ligase